MIKSELKPVLALLAFSLLNFLGSAEAGELDLNCFHPGGEDPAFECSSVREVKVVRIKNLGTLRDIEAFQDSLLCGWLGFNKGKKLATMNFQSIQLWYDYRVQGDDRQSYFQTEDIFITEVDGLFDPRKKRVKLGIKKSDTTKDINNMNLEMKIDKEEGTVDFRLRADRFFFDYRQELRIVYEDCQFRS